MAEPQGSSFIPQAPVKGQAAKPRGRKVYILSYVSFVMFFGALIATGIVYFLGFQQDKALELQQQRLSEQSALVSESSLIEVQELNGRLEAAKNILSQNTSPVSVLSALEFTMLRSIGILDFAVLKQEDDSYMLEITAESEQFNSPLFQREIIEDNPVLRGAEITEVLFGRVEAADDEGTGEPIIANGVQFKIRKALTQEDIPHNPNAAASLSSFGTEEFDTTIEITGESEIVDLDSLVLPDNDAADSAEIVDAVDTSAADLGGETLQ